MSQQVSKNQFISAALDYIPRVWVKRKSSFRLDGVAQYPGRVTEVLDLTIDGQEMVFFVSIVGRLKTDVKSTH